MDFKAVDQGNRFPLAKPTEGKLRACITWLPFDRISDLSLGGGYYNDSFILLAANKTVQTEDMKTDLWLHNDAPEDKVTPLLKTFMEL